ncbi:DUF551 domain-containing protein [Escherichia coli]|nr:DUF551 domain-containing protein [Escherichia coli]MGQ65304.1 DUF551 domain-containing protein [Escherichia coli]
MSKINYQALREAAEKATKGSYIVGHTSVNQHGNITGVFVCQKWKGEPGGVIAECHVNCLVETDAQAYANAEFIAEVNPATMLALLDEREAQNKCIAELEKIATDYALKFQKAQDALKYVVLMRKSEQEAAENNLIDSECHVAELEEALRDKQALLEASEKRIAELRDWNAGLAQESLTYQQRVAELEVIKSAAEKLVRCKGRYHSEQNYRALAALFGVTVPDLPPLEAESVSQTYKLNELSGNSPVTPDMTTGWQELTEQEYEFVKDNASENAEFRTVYTAPPATVVPDERAAFNAWNNDENLPIAGVGAKNAAWLAWQARAELGRSLAVNSPVTPDGWISCSERMPSDAQWCVVDAADGYYVQCWSEGQGWLGDDISLRNCDVIRWMPIPEPPQQDGE